MVTRGKFWRALLIVPLLLGFFVFGSPGAQAVAVNPELRISATVKTPVQTGEILTLSVNVFNDGPAPANGVNIITTLPPGLEFADVPVVDNFLTIGGVFWCELVNTGTGFDPPFKACGIGYNLMNACTKYGKTAMSCPLQRALPSALLYQGKIDPANYWYSVKVKVVGQNLPRPAYITNTVQTTSVEVNYANNTALLALTQAAAK